MLAWWADRPSINSVLAHYSIQKALWSPSRDLDLLPYWNDKMYRTPPKIGGDVAQLAERRTGTQLTQIPFPGTARDFSPSTFSADSLTVLTPPLPRVKSHAFTSVRTLKIP